MKIISYLNSFIIPAMVLAIILFGIYKKTDVFSATSPENMKQVLQISLKSKKTEPHSFLNRSPVLLTLVCNCSLFTSRNRFMS